MTQSFKKIKNSNDLGLFKKIAYRIDFGLWEVAKIDNDDDDDDVDDNDEYDLFPSS